MTQTFRYFIQPQRKLPKRGWCACQPHQAKRWSVIRSKDNTTVTSAKTAGEAKAALHLLNQSTTTRPAVASPPRKVIASSLTLNQHLALLSLQDNQENSNA